MKKVLIVGLLAVMFAGGIGCTNMSRTQQGVASGAAWALWAVRVLPPSPADMPGGGHWQAPA